MPCPSVLPSLLVVLTLGFSRAWGRHFLHYASPGDPQHAPGLWGGFVDYHDGGWAHDLHQTSFHCVNLKNDRYYDELQLQGLSVDDLTSSVVMEMDDVTETSTSAFTAPICSERNSCRQDLGDVLFSVASTSDSLQQAKLGPYAIWNGTVYFVARRYLPGVRSRSRQMRMEVRRLGGCGHLYPFTSRSEIDLDACSEFVALVVEETAESVVLAMRETLKPSDHLFILERHGSPVFLLQVYNYTFRDEVLEAYNMHLLSARPGSSQSAVELHREPLPLRYTWHILGQLGGISLRDGLLCWTATDRILCGHWADHGLLDIRHVLQPGAARQVCTGTTDHPIYANVTSGLAIAEVGKEGVFIYFGCFAGRRGVGGAGLLRLSADWSLHDIYRLEDRGGPVYAGSMALTDACDALYERPAQDEGFKMESPVPLQDPTTPYTLSDDPNSHHGNNNPPYDAVGQSGWATSVPCLPLLLTVCTLLMFCLYL